MTASSITCVPTCKPPRTTAVSGWWPSSPPKSSSGCSVAANRSGQRVHVRFKEAAPSRRLLLLRARPRLRAGVHQDLHLLPLSGQGVGQRPRVGQTPSRPCRCRLHGVGQRVRGLRRARAAPSDLRPVRTRGRAGFLRPVDLGHPDAVHRRGSGRGLLVGAVDAPSRGVSHPGVRRPPSSPRVLRSPGGRQHRHRPPRRGRRRVRAARFDAPETTCSAPGSSGRAPR